MQRFWFGASVGLVMGLVAACDSQPKTNPFETKKDTVEPPPIKEAPKPPKGPPEMSVSQEGPKVGWTYILLDKPDGKQKLVSQIAENKEFVSGKDVPLRADRTSKLAHVAAMVQALADGGATSIVVSTDSRPEFPKTVKFVPGSVGKSAPSCSVVAKVLTERRNAVWSLKGGTAVKSPKGMAGPDMAMTEESLEAAARRCKDSDFVFVSADEDVEWGLVYDLAAATQSLEKAKLGRVVLVEPAPVAGRPVKLDRRPRRHFSGEWASPGSGPIRLLDPVNARPHVLPPPERSIVATRKSSTKKARPPKRKAKAEPSDREDTAEASEASGDDEESSTEESDEPAEVGEEQIETEADPEGGDVEVVDDAALEHIVTPKGGAKHAIQHADPLQLYMSEVQRHKLLTPDEEHSLAVDYGKTGNVDAAARLVTSNLRLVVKIAYEYRRAYRNIMDLIQEGNIGLMQAVKRYDPYRGVKLSSYAAWWIRAYMLRFILNNWRLVKIGTTQAQRRLFFNLNKEKARLTAMGIEPSHAQIAMNLRVDEKDVVEMDRRLARGDASLDAPVGDADGRQTTRMELLATTVDGPEAAAESTELSELVRERLDEFRKTLSGKDLQIFDERVVAEDPLTLQQLGDRFGVSRERVRQLEARLTGKLRQYLKSELGDAVEVGA